MQAQPPRTVYKSNTLVTAIFKLNVNEFRLFILLLAEIDQREVISTEEFITLDISSFAERFGLDRHYAYAEVKKACQELVVKKYNIPASFIYPGEPVDELIDSTWLEACKFNNNTKTVVVRFGQTTADLISSLDGNLGFISYKLENAHNLKSFYSLRLFELFLIGVKPDSEKKIRYTVEKFKTMLLLEGKCELYGHFKANVLAPALKDVNEHTDLIVNIVDEVREGKKIVAIEFNVKRVKPIKQYSNDMSVLHKMQFKKSTGIDVDV